MKEKVKYLTVNAFSKIFGITKHTLYHYEDVGIFKPIYVSPTGYRYYSYTQYDQLRFIRLLREMDVPLEEIKRYLDDEIDIETLLLGNIAKLKERLVALTETVTYMEDILKLAKRCETIQTDEIFIEEQPERILYGETVKHLGKDVDYQKSIEGYAKFCYDHGVDADDVSGARIKLSNIRNGYPYRYDFNFTDHQVEDHELTKEILPAGRWLSIYFKGRYEDCYQAYLKLMDYGKKQGLQLDDVGYEVYVTNNITEQKDDAQIIKVTIRILM